MYFVSKFLNKKVFFFFIYIPISVHLSSSLLIVCDQLLVNLPAVLHIGQRILLVAFPHHKQDHYDWENTAEESMFQNMFSLCSSSFILCCVSSLFSLISWHDPVFRGATCKSCRSSYLLPTVAAANELAQLAVKLAVCAESSEHCGSVGVKPAHTGTLDPDDTGLTG